ncbi:MAG: hypothetical protein CMJ18_12580 [Phycisphaeraceae bacterium]|nr:hypothetical protein [Phycisphaeraceae bacterium]
MIQVVKHPDLEAEPQVRAYLGRCRSPQACAEHDPRWLHVLRGALGHEPYMLVARDEAGDVCGYLPAALVAGRLFGRFLVSLPYLNRAGVVADDPDAAAQLVDAAIDLARSLDVRYLELRHVAPVEHDGLPRRRDEKHLMLLDLPDDPEALWKSVGPKVRNQVRKGDKQALELDWGGRELVDAFYRVFSVNMRDLGTPVYPRRLFELILEHLGDEAELAVVRRQGMPIAAAILVHGAGETAVPSASSLRRYNATNANMWMYHKLLDRAIERGSRRFDFGRSSEGTGTYRFKKQWGAKPHQTVWQYHLRYGDVDAVRPDSPRYRRRIATWQKLPVWVTRLVGPSIVKNIP